jgi:hypothetical protein
MYTKIVFNSVLSVGFSLQMVLQSARDQKAVYTLCWLGCWLQRLRRKCRCLLKLCLTSQVRLPGAMTNAEGEWGPGANGVTFACVTDHLTANSRLGQIRVIDILLEVCTTL